MVVFAAFFAFLFDNWRISKLAEPSTYVPREAVMTPEIELLREYIRFDTSNPPGNEAEAAAWMAGLIGDAGVEVELIESAPRRVNLIARLEGRSDGEGLLLTHHIDVVPAQGDHWTEPPFAANVKMNQVYGRGALDMKSIGICHLVAFLDLARSGEALERDVVFLAVADEEEGGALGMAWLVTHRPEIFEGIAYALNEGGVAESLQEEVTYFGVEVGTKQMVRLEIRGQERRQLERARTALLPLQSPEDVTRVIPEVPPTLALMSTHREWGRELLRDVEKTIAEGNFWRLHRSYRVLMQNVAQLGGITRDERGPYFVAYLQNLPDQDPLVEISRVRAIVEPLGAEVIVRQVQGPAPVSSWNTPFFSQIEAHARATYGDITVGPQLLQFTSNDSRYLRSLGIDAYGLWPFPVNLYQTHGIHGIDERVRLDWFMSGVTLSRELVHDWAIGRTRNGNVE